MSLNKDDLKQIRTVVKEEISISEKKLGKKIEDEVGSLAAMTKRGFDAVDNDLKTIRQEQLVHDFKMTEMVHKSDHSILKERVTNIEAKMGMRK